jgi:hypothetical protein
LPGRKATHCPQRDELNATSPGRIDTIRWPVEKSLTMISSVEPPSPDSRSQ